MRHSLTSASNGQCCTTSHTTLVAVHWSPLLRCSHPIWPCLLICVSKQLSSRLEGTQLLEA